VEKTNSLLSHRFSSKNPKNIIKSKKLSFPVSAIQTSSHKHCPVCGNGEGWLIAEVDRVGFPCDTVICKNCQFVINDSYLSNPISFYEKYWGEEHWGDPEENWMKRTSPNAYTWKRMAYLAQNLGDRFKKINSVLEIGCGDGCNLYPYHLMGKEVIGLDYDERYLNTGRARGMNLLVGDIKTLPVTERFDLIQLIHVYEHMQDLNNVVLMIKEKLGKDGIVYVEVPGILNWNRKQSEFLKEDGFKSSNNILGYLQFQHNYHFDLSHLSWFWERNGFKMIFGDEWVRAIFQLKNGKGVSNNCPRFRTKNLLKYLKTIEKEYNDNLLINRKKRYFSLRRIIGGIKRKTVEFFEGKGFG
jgi:hypothetical protein|tara:strand:+ start:1799 stop:2866 length:1068 start_codon:yes stop_codon:yes gene_type:complete